LNSALLLFDRIVVADFHGVESLIDEITNGPGSGYLVASLFVFRAHFAALTVAFVAACSQRPDLVTSRLYVR
jgi:hypothetical protein